MMKTTEEIEKMTKEQLIDYLIAVRRQRKEEEE